MAKTKEKVKTKKNNAIDKKVLLKEIEERIASYKKNEEISSKDGYYSGAADMVAMRLALVYLRDLIKTGKLDLKVT